MLITLLTSCRILKSKGLKNGEIGLFHNKERAGNNSVTVIKLFSLTTDTHRPSHTTSLRTIINMQERDGSRRLAFCVLRETSARVSTTDTNPSSALRCSECVGDLAAFNLRVHVIVFWRCWSWLYLIIIRCVNLSFFSQDSSFQGIFSNHKH